MRNWSIYRNSEMQNGARSSTSTDDGAADITIDLKKGEMGFGFRIVGGQEEKTQVRECTFAKFYLFAQ